MNDILLAEAKEKGRLLSEALKIIEKLSKNEIADTDFDIPDDDENIEDLKRLIIKARTLKSDRWWDSINK